MPIGALQDEARLGPEIYLNRMNKLAQFGHPLTYPKVVALMQLKPGARVLDVGAGSGHFSRELARRGYQVQATDLEHGQCKFAAEEIPFKPVNINMAGELPFESESFEAVACVEIVEHLENHYDLVRKCRRVLVRNGVIVITTPNILNLASRLKFLMTGHFSMFGHQHELLTSGRYFRPQAHISPCSYWELRHSLHTNGFTIRRVGSEKIRKSALVLTPFLPLVWLCSQRQASAGAEKFGPEQIQRNREAVRHVLSAEVLFGKSLIVVATKD